MGDQVERAIAVAQSKLGAPYVWATAGPATFDCSGFTWWVASQVLGPQDHELRSSHHQFNVWGERVRGDSPIGLRGAWGGDSPLGSRGAWGGALAPGDLVFFDVGLGTIMGNRAGHVGMMIDAERFIHAANEDLGVRIDALDAEWYRPKFIGARRIFVAGPTRELDPESPAPPRPSPTLPDMIFSDPVLTPNPWNGGPFGVSWGAVYQWADLLDAAAREQQVDVRQLAVVMMVETQGMHERDGQVIEVWDAHPAHGPSVGLMQVKPWVWQYLVPTADAYDPVDNIRLGAAVLRHLIDRYGSWERAIAEGYHPGVSPNGTTPARYVEAMRGLLGELGYAESNEAVSRES